MPKFSNGKITSSAVLYDRGVPQDNKRFALIASLNYGMLRQVVRYSKQHGLKPFTLF
jgi:hypothetical protein